jgi:hypothetical protein
MNPMKKKIYTTISVIIIAVAISSCDHFLDVNTSPTALKTALINQAFTAAEVSSTFYQGADLYLYSSEFVQQATGSGVTSSQTRQYDQYIVTNSDVNNAYTNYYAGSLADLDYVKKLGFSTGNPNYAGVAKILQAYVFSTLVDAWGDIPYKEALKGVANVQPKYDNSKEVYDSLFVLIDAGIANMKQPSVRALGTDDLIYGGDLTKWEKFGNTLKLRLALHYAKDDGGAKFASVLTAGGPFMTANSDNYQMAFENVTGRQNPIHQFELSRQDYYAPAQRLVNLMNTKLDPRRGAYFTSYPSTAGVGQVTNITAGPWVGTPSGATQTNPNSRIHTYFRGSVTADNGNRVAGTAGTNGAGAPTATAVTYDGIAPLRMLLYSEYCFIRAEATLMYGASAAPLASAQAWFTAGITASFADVNATVPGAVPAAAATAYQTANGTLSATPATALQQIIEEKFVSNFGVVMESWTDWRRTGFPTITASTAAAGVGNSVIPRILVYPLSEQQTNSANLPARPSGTVKGVFWDK